ncbi:MAG: lactate utilization protein [Spirochaetes bacterium]|nr:lactate utilization protein [Spirochaetota bacterium]
MGNADVKKTYNAAIAGKLICSFRQRGIEGHYFEDSKSLIPFLKDLIPAGSLVSWGGSMTLNETGVLDFLRKGKYKVLDRDAAETPEKLAELYIESFSADYYFTSANAITLDGMLVNIDGRGNRVAAMCYGPKNVIVIAGINKVAADEKEAISRIRNHAAPLNAIRLSKVTPCVSSGICENCFDPGCICSYTVITRKSNIPDRIKVFLVGEDLGY